MDVDQAKVRPETLDARYRRVALAILGGTALLAVARVAFDSLT